jgi:hypothetical protein
MASNHCFALLHFFLLPHFFPFSAPETGMVSSTPSVLAGMVYLPRVMGGMHPTNGSNDGPDTPANEQASASACCYYERQHH